MIAGFWARPGAPPRGAVCAGVVASMLAGCAGRSVLEVGVADAGADADAAPIEDAGAPPVTTSDALDLLLVIDNSRNLEGAHEVLAQTIPYLLDRLVNPPCVNGLGNVVDEPASPSAPCSVGKRDFAPLADFHVGVISTSLGGHGADVCSPQSFSWKPAQNDAAHLLTRAAGGGVVPTHAGQGFLAWDPGQAQSPPGEADLPAMVARLGEIVRGAGSEGCGFESQLESIYRFLADPEPPAEIVVLDGKATPVGVDAVVLQQRADFLRPDSLVAVVLFSDENDCSTREGGQFFLSNQGLGGDGTSFHLPRSRSECDADPGDPCCASCAQATPAGCSPTPSDPKCQLPPMTEEDGDPINLRCFDQKRRFGIDFLYPVERYVEALTEPTVATRDGQVVPNPLFAAGRSSELVVMAGILGVPWQDVANDPKVLASGYLGATAIDWSLLLPDRETGAPPLDPLMIESVAPRSGVHPPTGLELAPPGSPQALANPINGHERVIAFANDLQYACIYPLATPSPCFDVTCDCYAEGILDNPVCQQPDGSFAELRRFGRAVPSTRELEVLRGLGDRAAVASICAAEVVSSAQPAFGYKPAVDALMRALRPRIE